MALTDAERKRRSRANKKIAVLTHDEASSLLGIVQTPFFASPEMEANWSDIASELDAIGMDVRGFYDDSPNRSYDGEAFEVDDLIEKPAQNSLGRAEVIVGGLISAGQQLAAVINAYKRREIDARIAEVEQSDLSDPDVKKQAFADMARLKKMRDQLDKQVRWTFQQWKVTGE
jgi:hypothetical protein